MVNITQENRQARLDTPLGTDVLLLQNFHGVETLSEPFHYSMTVLCKDVNIDGAQLIGKPVAAIYFNEDGHERCFHGLVNHFEYLYQNDEPENLAAYQVNIVPWLWFLKHNLDCRIFQNMTAPDIIKQLFRGHRFAQFRSQLTEDYAEREYCVQYGESDFDFVSRLMEEEGIYYYFEHEKGRHTLVMSDSTHGYIDLNQDVIYSPIGQDHIEQLTEWRHIYAFQTGSVAQRDFNFKNPLTQLETKSPTQVGFDISDQMERFEYPGFFNEQNDGNRLAIVRAQQFGSDHDRVEGKGFYTTFTPGGRFNVVKHLRTSEENRQYVLTQVMTEFNSNIGFGNDNSVDFCNEFCCMDASKVFRPQRKTRKPVVEGPQTAIVVTDGQEIVVDEHARVKVQFHWDRYGKRDITSSCWIRVSQAHAGHDWGMIDIPRKGDEVIVSFLDGDPDRPIITGRVYNGENHPPYNLKGAGNNLKNKTRRGNTTKTYEDEGFNEISMDDAKGKEQIRIHAQKNMDSFVLANSNTTVKGSLNLTIGKDGDPEPSGDQTELLWRDKIQTVKRHHYEHIEGNKFLTVGKGSAEGGNLDVVIAEDEVKRVNGNMHLTVGGAVLQKFGDSLSVRVDGDAMHKVNGDVGVEAGSGNEIHLKAGKLISIESDSVICLKTPGGFITLDNSGVHISGTIVNINSGGASPVGRACNPTSPKQANGSTGLEPPTPADCYQIDHDRDRPSSSESNSQNGDSNSSSSQAGRGPVFTPVVDESQRRVFTPINGKSPGRVLPPDESNGSNGRPR